MSATIGTYGVKVLLPLLKLIGTSYLGLAIIVFGLFPLVALFLKIPIREVYKMASSMVVLLATATAVGLPAEGVALILGVDRVIDMARTAVNVWVTCSRRPLSRDGKGSLVISQT